MKILSTLIIAILIPVSVFALELDGVTIEGKTPENVLQYIRDGQHSAIVGAYGFGVGTRGMINRPYNGMIYGALKTDPCTIFELPATIPIPATFTDTIECQAGITRSQKVVMDYTRGYLFAAGDETVIERYTVSPLTYVDTITLPATPVGWVKGMVIDEPNGFLYIAEFNNEDPDNATRVHKYNVETLALLGTITLEADERSVAMLILDTSAGYLYAGTKWGVALSDKIVRIRLSDFTRLDKVDITEGVVGFCYDAVNQMAYYTEEGTPSQLYRVNLETMTNDATPVTMPNGIGAAACYYNNGHVYVAHRTSPLAPDSYNIIISTVNVSTWSIEREIFINDYNLKNVRPFTVDIESGLIFWAEEGRTGFYQRTPRFFATKIKDGFKLE